LDQPSAIRGQCDAHSAPIVRVGLAADEAIALQAFDDLGHRRRRTRPVLRKPAGPAGPGLQAKEHPGPLERADVGGLRRARGDGLEQSHRAEQSVGERELILGWCAAWNHLS